MRHGGALRTKKGLIKMGLRYFQLFSAGYCTHPECITQQGGAWTQKKFPALCALVEHPTIGYVLFDTGYSPTFYESTRQFPLSLYRYVTPVTITPETTLEAQLKQQHIAPEAIQVVVLSHFHADHIGGLKGFPNARIICSQAAYEHVAHRTGLSALRQGFIRALLPQDWSERVHYVENKQTRSLPLDFSPFTEGYDLFDDGLLYAVPLPGHAKGQIGLAFVAPDGKPTFLIADSCWSSEALSTKTLPSQLTRIVHHDWRAYKATLTSLHQLYHQHSCRIIPSHCQGVILLRRPKSFI